LPQTHVAQSVGHSCGVSPQAVWQLPLPQRQGSWQERPHTVWTSITQSESHELVQQKESTAQISATHGSQLGWSSEPWMHLS
jgi:hypothetical protein